jgi:hypothetical protein
MPYQPNDLLSRHFQEQRPDLISKVEEQLNLVSPNSPNLPIYRDMILTVLRMAQEDHNRWNAKITLQALRELEQAFRVLEQFKGRRKVTVFGSARTPVEHPLYAMARELGAALARSDLMVITGAGGGIMAAAHEGAGLTTAWASTSPCPSNSMPTRRWTAPATCCRSTFSSPANCSSSRKPMRWCCAPAGSAPWMKHWKS